MSAAAPAKILRLNADATALRDLRFAVSGEPLPAAKLLSLWLCFGVQFFGRQIGGQFCEPIDRRVTICAT